MTPANATTFNFTIPAGIFTTPSSSSADWKITISADNYTSYSFTQRINAFSSPTLTAEANRYFNDSNSNPISIGVGATNDTQAWRDAITAIQIGGTTINRADFEANKIIVGAPGTPIKIDEALITAPGSIKINIIASNYQTTSVDQPLYKQGVTLTSPAGTIYAGKDLVMTFNPGAAASDWISVMKAGGDIKFGGNSIKTRAVIDETSGTLKIPYDLVRTNGGAAVSRSLVVSAPGYADVNVNATVTPQTAPVIALSSTTVTPQFGDTITYSINGDDNPLWRSSILLAATSDQSIDNGDVTIQLSSVTSVKPYVTTSVKSGTGSVTIDGNATQSTTAAGNKNVKFISPYFTPITIAQPFAQRTAPTPSLTPSGVNKPVIITVPNNTENMRWANAIKAVTGDITVDGVSTKSDTTISSDESNITITLPGTAFSTTGNKEIKFTAYCYPDTKVTQVIKKNPPVFASKIAYIQEDTPITINYNQDSDWLAASPVVSLNGKVVDSSKYTLTAKELTFVDRSLFKDLGDYNFTISAPDYIDTSFTIIISDDLSHLISATSDSNGKIDPDGFVSIKHGSNQTFKITPNTGFEIGSVKVDGQEVTVTNGEYTFTNVTKNHSINVTFKQIVHIITATAGSNGTISPNGRIATNYGTNQTFNITPYEGYEVSTFKVDGVDAQLTNNAYTFTNVTKDHTINVTFKQIVHTINATTGSNGIISPSGSVSVNHGKDQTFTITPNKGYEVATFTVDGVSTNLTGNSYTFTNVTKDHTINVTFKKIIYTIIASAEGNGTISPSGILSVDEGANQTYKITPDKGSYEVATFKVDGVDVQLTNNTYTFTNITKNHTISVTFKHKGSGGK
ncbi:hemoblobin-interacting domain-containing protein [Bacillus sp. AFS053548]|uniref:hemoblobin-interacting domain-containing protein n=1 Tax=Bacillus sp. AFS053548 TaxID=2033505 RepID=UPI0011452058|nr:hemoblobin-interacting domain-containing protein [Bacillus sp. AFS053548]